LGHLPPISKNFILDKSKADHFAKVLVLIQASWLIIQCIARTMQNLPLSLLELNTVAKVGCALIMYFVGGINRSMCAILSHSQGNGRDHLQPLCGCSAALKRW
jgi:hypothetical protein